MPDLSAIDWEADEDGVVTLTIDDPTQNANTMNDLFNKSLAATVDRLAAESASIRGVIVTSGKKMFFAGGDLRELVEATPDDREGLYRTSVEFKSRLRRLETLGVPVVAALNGTALGGGLEIALACHHRIAVAEPSARFGLPEVTLGLLPGAGGVVRTVRMLGVEQALTEVLWSGEGYRADAARELGLVDEVVADQTALLARAREWVLANPDAAQPWDRPGYAMPGGRPSEPPLSHQLAVLPARLRTRTKGAPDPARHNILCAAVEGAQVDVESAARIESRYFVELVTGQIAKNLIKSRFFDLQKVNRIAARPAGYPTWRPGKITILGAGMMGAGIAYQCALSGFPVVLKDVDIAAAERGRAYSERLLDRAVSRGRKTAEFRQEILDRITVTADAADCAGADLVIEAVFEDQKLKEKVLHEVEAVVPRDTVIASNTSTLPITGLSAALTLPRRFIGMHFFSPVDRMPLLEIIVGQQTSEQTIARALDLARALRKSPIIVNDSRGFFTSRVIGPFIDEGVAMLGEGVDPMILERAATEAGYPVGTLQLTDELNMILAQRVRRETKAALEAEGRTFVPHAADAVRDKMVELGRPGRQERAGFYDYDEDGRRTGLWRGIYEQFRRPVADLDFETIKDRMLFAQTLEAIRCIEEGVVRSAADANIGSLLGIGFPPWTGGVLQFANQYDGGLARYVARADELALRFGPRFTPPRLARDMAVAGEEFR